MLPTFEQTAFADSIATRNTQFIDGWDTVRVNNSGMEDEGVGDNGHGHTRGLLAIFLMEGLRHSLQYLTAGCFAQFASGFADALLQNLCSLGKQPFGQCDVFNAGSKIINTAGKPTLRRPAHDGILFLQRKGTVTELGGFDLPL